MKYCPSSFSTNGTFQLGLVAYIPDCVMFEYTFPKIKEWYQYYFDFTMNEKDNKTSYTIIKIKIKPKMFMVN